MRDLLDKFFAHLDLSVSGNGGVVVAVVTDVMVVVESGTIVALTKVLFVVESEWPH